MAGQLFKTNPLIFPGRLPGFNPNHLASRGLVKGTGLSWVSRGANGTNLLNGAKGTVVGTATNIVSNYDGIIGRSTGFTSANHNALNYSGNATTNNTSLTFAAVFKTPALIVSDLITNSSASSGIAANLTATGQLSIAYTSVNSVNWGSNVISINTPYFAIWSVSVATINWLLLNLNTGKILTVSVANTNTPVAPNGTFGIGANSGDADWSTSNIAAAMIGPSFLSIAQMRQWAQDPWAFWYPRTQDILGLPPTVKLPAPVIFDRPPVSVIQPDFQAPPNTVLLLAIPATFPSGKTLDETVPSPQAHPVDFPFRNVGLLNFAQLQVYPNGQKLDETVPSPQAKPVDFAFPNIGLQNFAQLQVYPNGSKLDETVPAPRATPVDFQFPNLPLLNFAQLQVHSVGQQIDETVPLPQRLTDFQFLNIAIQTPVTAATPVIPLVFADRPAPVARQQDVFYPNLVFGSVTQYVFRTPQIDRPGALPGPQDFQFPNIAIQPTAAAATPFVSPLFDIRPPQPQPQDFQATNIVLENFAQLQVKPLFSPIFERAPIPLRPQDPAPVNILAAILSVVPGVSLLSDRPPPVPRPQDPAQVNLLPTLLTATAGTPFLPNISLFGDRPAPASRQQDPALPDLIGTLLATTQAPPFVANISLFNDRPAPMARQLDQAPFDFLVNRPIIKPTGLHQNPFFITMGRLAQLGNLPS
jgi:hypothetical protein